MTHARHTFLPRVRTLNLQLVESFVTRAPERSQTPSFLLRRSSFALNLPYFPHPSIFRVSFPRRSLEIPCAFSGGNFQWIFISLQLCLREPRPWANRSFNFLRRWTKIIGIRTVESSLSRIYGEPLSFVSRSSCSVSLRKVESCSAIGSIPRRFFRWTLNIRPRVYFVSKESAFFVRLRRGTRKCVARNRKKGTATMSNNMDENYIRQFLITPFSNKFVELLLKDVECRISWGGRTV